MIGSAASGISVLSSSTVALLLPLVASLLGAAAAIFATIRASRTASQVARLEAELDRHKQVSLEYLRTYLTLEVEGRNRASAAFRDFIQQIQLTRDTAKRVLAYPRSFATAVLGDEMHAMRKALVDSYALNQTYFADDGPVSDRALAHSLKNECLVLAERLPGALDEHSSDNRQEIARMLESVTAKQAEFRSRAAAHADRLVDELKQKLEGLGANR